MKIQEKYSKKYVELSTQLENNINSLGAITYNLQLLNKNKSQLIEAIRKINTEKQSLTDQILQQYGAGSIDPETWEFIPSNTVGNANQKEKTD